MDNILNGKELVEYYQKLPMPYKSLFKEKVVKEFEWHPATFHRKVKEEDFTQIEIKICCKIVHRIERTVRLMNRRLLA